MKFVGYLLFASTVLTIAYVSAQRGQPSGPALPFEDIGACPFEGCVYRDWVANAPVTVRTDRNAASPPAFMLQKGEHVRAITGIVVTTKPGRVQFSGPANLWTTAGSLHVDASDTLFVLTYLGEGHWAAWARGRLYDAVDGSVFCATASAGCTGVMVEKPESVWWVRIQKNGVTGWTREPEKFDNKDELG